MKNLLIVPASCLLSLTAVMLCVSHSSEAAEKRPSIVQPRSPGRPVAEATMKQIYEEVKTPFKYGILIRGEDGKAVDCPSVFRHGNAWYMVYVCMNKVGYETHLASSKDLMHWNTLGKILSFPKTGWDAWQADGGIALHDWVWGGRGEPHTFAGKYWMSYLGGALQGYETDPLGIGIAWTTTPDKPLQWHRIAENPVLHPDQPDARSFEKATHYKSNIVYDEAESLGYPFVMYFNGKMKGCYERIGMAVSRIWFTGRGTASVRSWPTARRTSRGSRAIPRS